MDSIDLGRAFKAPFADKDWVKKTLLGFLWLLLGVTSPAVYGAQLQYIRGVSEGREELPDWDQFGDKWVKGFLLLVAGFIYFLPVFVLGLIFLIPVIAAAASESRGLGGLATGGMCFFSLIAIVYSVAVAVIFYGAMVNYALKGDFGALFAFSDILGHVRDGSGYWAAWLWAIVVAFGVSIVSSVLSATGIGAILMPAVLYLQIMVTAHLFGQWAARSYGISQMPAPTSTPGYVPPAGTYAPPPPPPAPAPQATTPAPAPAPAAPVAPATPPAAAPAPAPEAGFAAPAAPPAPAPAAPPAPTPEPAPPVAPATPPAPPAPEPPSEGDAPA